MEIDTLRLLNFLKDYGGLHKQISIAPLIDELVESPPDFNGYTIALRPIYRLMATLVNDKLIEYNEIPSPNGSTYTWDIVKNINIELTTKGDTYLKDNLLQDTVLEVNRQSLENYESTKELQQSVIDTNKSIIETNKMMAGISVDQRDFNRTIAGNSDTQATASRRQTTIFRWTAIFAFCAMAIAGVSLYEDFHKDTLSQSISQKDSLISILQKNQYRLKIDSSRLSEEVKTLTKKH